VVYMHPFAYVHLKKFATFLKQNILIKEISIRKLHI
jgi:hypothetical protein